LQSAEHLWPLVREGLANKVFDALPAMTAALATRCRWLTEHTDEIAGAVGFHLGRRGLTVTNYHDSVGIACSGRKSQQELNKRSLMAHTNSGRRYTWAVRERLQTECLAIPGDER
jgi:hypothetical protein